MECAQQILTSEVDLVSIYMNDSVYISSMQFFPYEFLLMFECISDCIMYAHVFLYETIQCLFLCMCC